MLGNPSFVYRNHHKIIKMSMYPSLEDMQVGQMAKAELAQNAPTPAAVTYSASSLPPPYTENPKNNELALYPSLNDMGIQMTPDIQRQLEVQVQSYVVQPSSNPLNSLVTGNSNLQLQRSEIKQGVRQITLCKDASGKIGLRVRAISKGMFVAFVSKNSPAALGGLRFGDQILQINGENVAGWDTDKCMKVLQKTSATKIEFAIRDRPFERIITMQKDSTGHIGFVFKNCKITAIVKDSSAARNGVLIDHYLVEVGGQNVIGLKDKEVSEIINHSGSSITITVMPAFVFEHMIKSMADSLKKLMDHSLPEA